MTHPSPSPQVEAEPVAWRCAKCDSRSFARMDTRLPDTFWGPGDFVRCVNCKDVSFFPDLTVMLDEREALRQIISECATATGAFVAPHASLDFMKLLPREIAANRAGVEAQLAAMRVTLETLTSAVENMRIPQNVAEAAIQVELTLGPAVKAARAALTSHS